MGFHDGLCQRQAQPDALLVLGKAAAVEPLENMVQVLRMDAAAVVLYGDLNGIGQSFPCNMNRVAALRMVEGVFHDVVNGLGQPVAVAEKKDLLRAGQDKFFMLLFGPVCEMQLNIPQHIRHILGPLFQRDGTGVQPCDLQPKGTMYTWIKAFKEGRLSANEAVHTPKNALSLNDELIELRKCVKEQDKEIRRLKEENEFLEEASAFFAASRRKSAKNRD